MVGEPYKFTDFVPQKIERYITNSTIVNQINKIKILINDLQSSEYNSLELYSAIWTQDTNDYKVTFKNPTRVDYITDKENDKIKFSLQAILLKNNKTFATNTCKYLWFKQNVNITRTSDKYSFYGGEGWELLNEVENITYLDINQIERTDRVIKNNIGSTYIIDKIGATMYHNYYKCIVLYNNMKIESATKHILNIDAAGDVNLRLGQVTGEATAAQVIEPNETISTFTEDGFYLGFVFNAVADISKYKVTIVRKTDQDDNEITYIFSTSPNVEKGEKQIYNLDGKYYSTIKQDYDKSYTAYIYTCSVVSEVEENKFTLLESVEKSYLSANSEIKEIIQYYDYGDNVIISEPFTEEDWLDNYTDISNWETTNILARKKFSGVKNSEWEYYWYSIKGSRQSAQQRDTFNRLTKNGTERGLYYGKGYVETADKEPDKNKTYYLYDDTSGYTKQENLTAFEANKIYYEYNNNALFFNADYINTGSLRVGNNEDERFFADIKSSVVRIGGFVVDNKTLKSKDGSVGISVGYQSNTTSSTKWVLWSGATKNSNNPGSADFRVDVDGNLYAYSGNIGGWTISSSEIYCQKAGINGNSSSTIDSLWEKDPKDSSKMKKSPVRFYCGNTNIIEGKFKVLNDGSLYAEAAKITGNISANEGNIGNLKILNGVLTGDSFTLSSDGLSFKNDSNEFIFSKNGLNFGNKFLIKPEGSLICGEAFSLSSSGSITANAGKIGGIVINANGLNLANGGTISLGNYTNITTRGIIGETVFQVGGNKSYLIFNKSLDAITIRATLQINAVFYWNPSSGTNGIKLSFRVYRNDYISDTDNNISISFIDTITFSSHRWTGWKNETVTHTTNLTNIEDKSFDYEIHSSYANVDTIKDVEVKAYFIITINNIEYRTGTQIFSTVEGKEMKENGFLNFSPTIGYYNQEINAFTETSFIFTKGNLVPYLNDFCSIGAEARRWNTGYFKLLYTNDGTVQRSDKNLKKDIQLLPIEYDLLYDKLEPVRYKFIQNESDRYHVGFISQEVEEALRLANLTSKDFAGFIKTKKEDSEDEFSYGLRYGEFIALNTDQIQKLKKRVLLLEQEIKEIKGENNNETL